METLVVVNCPQITHNAVVLQEGISCNGIVKNGVRAAKIIECRRHKLLDWER